MNLRKAFEEGQKGSNMGLPMGKGLSPISKKINGVQRKRIYTIGASPKGGKTTLVDVGFVIEPCLYVLDNNPKLKAQIEEIRLNYSGQIVEEQRALETDSNAITPTLTRISELQAKIIDLEIIYNSYEIDRISKEFDFVAHFLYRDYGILDIKLPEGVTFEGKDTVPLNAEFLMGQLRDDNESLIKVPASMMPLIKQIYNDRITVLFGSYDDDGKQETKGLITFMEEKDNPTGIRNYLMARAERNGSFTYSSFTDKEGKTHYKKIGYKRNNPNEFVLIVTDHVRKLVKERGFSMKENVDKYSEYCVELRNLCMYSFVQVIHLGRAIGNVERLKFSDDKLYPMNDDIKDTGNLSEDSNYVFTLFNPNDDKYNLQKHFDLKIRDPKGNLLFPEMRTIHLVDSRHCPFPQHFRVNMKGAVKHFEQLIIN